MKYCLLFLFCCFAPVLRAQPFAPFPPADPARSLEYAFNKADLLVAITDMTWRPGLCLATALVSVGETAELRLSLEANHDYTFVASGSRPSTDVDLYLRGPAGEIVTEDQEPDATPVLEFKTTAAGQYLLQLRLAGSERSEDFVSLAILSSTGSSLTKDDYQGVANRFFPASDQLRSTGAITSKKLEWWTQAPYWCVYGFLLSPQGGASLLDVSSGEAPLTVAATAGDGLKEVNLYLGSGDRILTDSGRKGQTPFLRYVPGVLNERLDLRVEVARAKVSDLVLLGVFQE